MNKCYGGYEPNPCTCIPETGIIQECDAYKQKSDDLYMRAHVVQEEAKRFICQSKELNEQAKELERKAREACAAANIAWDNARKLEAEAANLLDLACFYACKASECYKNINNPCSIPPTCGRGHCGCCK